MIHKHGEKRNLIINSYSRSYKVKNKHTGKSRKYILHKICWILKICSMFAGYSPAIEIHLVGDAPVNICFLKHMLSNLQIFRSDNIWCRKLNVQKIMQSKSRQMVATNDSIAAEDSRETRDSRKSQNVIFVFSVSYFISWFFDHSLLNSSLYPAAPSEIAFDIHLTVYEIFACETCELDL